MKIFVYFAVIIIALSACNPDSKNQKENNTTADQNSEMSGDIKISASASLYPFINKITSEFINSYPAIKIIIVKDAKLSDVDFALDYSFNGSKGGNKWKLDFAKDAIVPVFCKQNRKIQLLAANGFSKTIIKDIYFSNKYKSWEDALIVKSKKNTAFSIYKLPADSYETKAWASYFNSSSDSILGEEVATSSDIIEKVINNASGIGYCSSAFVFDYSTKLKKRDLYILPIDFNKNGVIDDDEHIYDDFEMFNRAIVTNKYPIIRNIQIIAENKPTEEYKIVFVKWLLTKGQSQITKLCYTAIDEKEAQNLINGLEQD